jgi:hypothetical protein
VEGRKPEAHPRNGDPVESIPANDLRPDMVEAKSIVPAEGGRAC